MKKFLRNPYPYISLGKNTLKIEGIEYDEWIYRFDGKDHKGSKVVYLARVEIYPDHLCAIKFHTKALSYCKEKYNRLTGYYDASRVLSTCLKIMFDLLEKNPFVSFCFVGSPSKNEKTDETKRFKVYKDIMHREFSPISFEHKMLKDKSVYLIINVLMDRSLVLRSAERVFEYYVRENLI